jgi:hypothetical protein
MAENDNKSKAPKAKKDFKKVSQSLDVVNFKASKNHGKLKKDTVYSVSQNVGEVLELKGLGKIIK